MVELESLRTYAVESVKNGQKLLMATFAAVPDDKLNWSPSATARSPLGIAAHAGLSNRFFAAMLRGEAMPDGAMEAAVAAEKAINTREAAVAMIELGVNEVVAALEMISPEQFGKDIVLPFMTAPSSFFMTLPGRHLDTHAAQIDYLQTAYGDNEFHVMM